MLPKFLAGVFMLLCATGLGLFLEIFWRRETMTIRDRLSGFMFWPFVIMGSVLVSIALPYGWKLVGVTEGLFSLGHWPGWAQFVIFVITWDFLFYWQHRLQHRFAWRFHSLHHSIEKMTATNSYHHWTEPLFTTAFVVIPITLLGIKAGPAAVAIFAFRMGGYLIHSPTRLHLGPLRAVLVDGPFHRIHHSTAPAHYDKNFGAFFTVWDRLFGTLHAPRKNEWPAIGLEGQPEPRNLRSYAAWGFSRPFDK